MHYRFPYVGAAVRSARYNPTLRDHVYGLVYHAMCLFTPQLSLVLTAPTHGGMAQAELTWLDGWFCAKVVCPS